MRLRPPLSRVLVLRAWPPRRTSSWNAPRTIGFAPSLKSSTTANRKRSDSDRPSLCQCGRCPRSFSRSKGGCGPVPAWSPSLRPESERHGETVWRLRASVAASSSWVSSSVDSPRSADSCRRRQLTCSSADLPPFPAAAGGRVRCWDCGRRDAALVQELHEFEQTVSARPGETWARDKTSGEPVTNFKRSTRRYRIAMSYKKGLDRDRDGDRLRDALVRCGRSVGSPSKALGSSDPR